MVPFCLVQVHLILFRPLSVAAADMVSWRALGGRTAAWPLAGVSASSWQRAPGSGERSGAGCGLTAGLGQEGKRLRGGSDALWLAGSVSRAACPERGPGTAGTLQHRRGRSACCFLRGQLGSARVGGRESCGWVPCSWQGCMLMPLSLARRAPLWDSAALGGCGLSALVASAAWASLPSHVVRCPQ